MWAFLGGHSIDKYLLWLDGCVELHEEKYG